MNTMTPSIDLTFDPEAHECRFQSFDDQLAQRIIMDSSLYIDDFDDEELCGDTYAYIKDEIEDRLATLGFALPPSTELIDNVFQIIEHYICKR